MSLALYRKYRPKSLENLIGQKEIAAVIKNAAKKDKLAHAYLLYGPRGSGKTTVARLIAKIANCETRKIPHSDSSRNTPFMKEGKIPRPSDTLFTKEGINSPQFNGEPCNKCNSCLTTDSGRALDVIEIDAASNRGVDEIRSLKEGIALAPTSSSYKVFIIDEAHMLTREAFNALLKTLEEPPKHAILILATTEYEKIPPTISSRTQKFRFKKLALGEIVKKLDFIIESEKIQIEPDAVELIAASAEGSLRDAESLLDQITALEQNVTLENVEEIIGQVGFAKTSTLADCILNEKLGESLEYLSKISDGGLNLVDLNKELIHYLRRVLAIKLDSSLEKIYKNELTNKELEQIKKHSAIIQPEKHIQLLKSLIRAYSEMRYSPFAIVPLEIAIIENLNAPRE